MSLLEIQAFGMTLGVGQPAPIFMILDMPIGLCYSIFVSQNKDLRLIEMEIDMSVEVETLDYIKYPEPKDVKCGNKVSWYYYDNQEDAEKASIAAENNSHIWAARGYDFGFMAPGEIRKVNDMWEVCIP